MSHTDNFTPLSFKFQQITLLQLGYQPEVCGFPIVKANVRILPQKNNYNILPCVVQSADMKPYRPHGNFLPDALNLNTALKSTQLFTVTKGH